MNDVGAVTDADFDSVVLRSDQPVLVDFWAAWCGPCRMIAPIVEQLAEEFKGRVKVVKMDVDANPQVAGRFGVLSLPTLIIFKNGEPTERRVGYDGGMKGKLRERLEAAL